jgi:hypothetical protein
MVKFYKTFFTSKLEGYIWLEQLQCYKHNVLCKQEVFVVIGTMNSRHLNTKETKIRLY